MPFTRAGRRCVGFELEPRYFGITAKRLQKEGKHETRGLF